MSADVLLIRHAEHEPRPGDPGLTEHGRRQARRMAAQLGTAGIVSVVSSPLRRALETAQPLADVLGLQVEVDVRLRERMNWTAGIAPQRFLDDWGRMDRDRTWVPETIAGARSSARTAEDLLEAAEDHAVEGRTTVLVTHGGAIVDTLRTLLGEEGLGVADLVEHVVPHLAATRLTRIAAGAWRVGEIATTDHLDDGNASFGTRSTPAG